MYDTQRLTRRLLVLSHSLTTEFWGTKGAGCLFFAEKEGTFLIAKRSEDVNEPGTWGTWGGAIDPEDKSPAAALRREVKEESGRTKLTELIPLYVFRKGTFEYHNFLAIVPKQFSPKLNWETDEGRWFKFGDWPKPLHPGLKALLADPTSIAIMQNRAKGAGKVKRSTGKRQKAAALSSGVDSHLLLTLASNMYRLGVR